MFEQIVPSPPNNNFVWVVFNPEGEIVFLSYSLNKAINRIKLYQEVEGDYEIKQVTNTEYKAFVKMGVYFVIKQFTIT